MILEALQIPSWFYGIAVSLLCAFTGFLIGIVTWFLGKLHTDNKNSWTEVKSDIKAMTQGINDLVIVTTKHHERISHHDEEIIELRKKL